MPLVIASFLLLAACTAPVSVAFEPNAATGRLRRSHLQVARAATASNRSLGSLKTLADSCKCTFRGLCSCEQALEFMACIQDACDSGACACEGHHYPDACQKMSDACPSAGLECGAADATCKRIPPMSEPMERRVKAAEPASETDEEPANLPASGGQGMATDLQNDVAHGRLWWMNPLWWKYYLLLTLANIGIAVLCAWIYNKQRYSAKPFFAPKTTAIDPSSHDDFGIGLFSCFSDLKLTLFTICCPCLRWADTLDRAGLLKYWPAFALFFFLSYLSAYTFGLTGFVLLLVCFGYRQRLRNRYKVHAHRFNDFFAWLCCSTCAIVQEARLEANSIEPNFG